MLRRIALLLCTGLLLCGLALRFCDQHAHEYSSDHSDSCAVCRVLHTPLAAPSAPLVSQPLALLDCGFAPHVVIEALSEPISLTDHLLRAPPSA